MVDIPIRVSSSHWCHGVNQRMYIISDSDVAGTHFSLATQFGGVTEWYQSQGYREPDTVMSSDSASSEEPEAAPESPDYVPGLKEPEQAPLSPDYVPGPEYPEYLAPSDEEVPMEDQPYAVADSSIALSPGYVADLDPEEDSEDGPVDYPADVGDVEDDDFL
ncbi:hypothetical protein Tco_0425597 [Tanacetum coccineum]